jgi:polyisoprenoid-binding protein YceI
MTKSRIAAIALLGLVSTSVTTVARAQTAKVPVSPESKLWINGTSSIHEWSCKADKLDASIEFDAASAAQPATATPKVLKVNVKVPVKSLTCNHAGMNDNVYKALKADDAPTISYILGTFKTADSKDGYTLKTNGTLNIAGKENPIEMEVVALRQADGSLKATGTVPVKMTDYGIKPPTMMFGRIKTGDEVKVSFELTVGAKAIATALNGGTDK